MVHPLRMLKSQHFWLQRQISTFPQQKQHIFKLCDNNTTVYKKCNIFEICVENKLDVWCMVMTEKGTWAWQQPWSLEKLQLSLEKLQWSLELLQCSGVLKRSSGVWRSSNEQGLQSADAPRVLSGSSASCFRGFGALVWPKGPYLAPVALIWLRARFAGLCIFWKPALDCSDTVIARVALIN